MQKAVENPDRIRIEQRWTSDVVYNLRKENLKKSMRRIFPWCILQEYFNTCDILPMLALTLMDIFPGTRIASISANKEIQDPTFVPALKFFLEQLPAVKYKEEDFCVEYSSVPGIPPSGWEIGSTRNVGFLEGFYSHFFRDKNGEVVFAPLILIFNNPHEFEDELLSECLKICCPDIMFTIFPRGEYTGIFFETFHPNKNRHWVFAGKI